MMWVLLTETSGAEIEIDLAHIVAMQRVNDQTILTTVNPHLTLYVRETPEEVRGAKKLAVEH
jgi:hypothetical protein